MRPLVPCLLAMLCIPSAAAMVVAPESDGLEVPAEAPSGGCMLPDDHAACGLPLPVPDPMALAQGAAETADYWAQYAQHWVDFAEGIGPDDACISGLFSGESAPECLCPYSRAFPLCMMPLPCEESPASCAPGNLQEALDLVIKDCSDIDQRAAVYICFGSESPGIVTRMLGLRPLIIGDPAGSTRL